MRKVSFCPISFSFFFYLDACIILRCRNVSSLHFLWFFLLTNDLTQSSHPFSTVSKRFTLHPFFYVWGMMAWPFMYFRIIHRHFCPLFFRLFLFRPVSFCNSVFFPPVCVLFVELAVLMTFPLNQKEEITND